MKKVLFVCYFGRDRSRTAAELFNTWRDCETRFGGVSLVADNLLSEEDIKWASIIFTMEPYQSETLRSRYRRIVMTKPVICLHIPDNFGFKDGRLQEILTEKVSPHLTST